MNNERDQPIIFFLSRKKVKVGKRAQADRPLILPIRGTGTGLPTAKNLTKIKRKHAKADINARSLYRRIEFSMQNGATRSVDSEEPRRILDSPENFVHR